MSAAMGSRSATLALFDQPLGRFVGPLLYIAVVALIGAFSYSVILGDIHRLTVDRS